ncbi:hydrogenase expression/formation protein HypE [candidate division KSB1 bacterium]|nr:MAG: hydrogenase expression/formation protein HypE [candidate division KSB1 bacterium]
MRSFIKKLFVENFSNAALNSMADAALLEFSGKQLAFTTDSYVVKPLEFPGGNIGKLAVCGTVNDLAVMGAKPLALSTGFIIEEGFNIAALERIVLAMAETARAAGVQIVTGDTKVVARGEADGIFINTSGVGVYPLLYDLREKPVVAGDALLVSGTVGDHGIAILGARGNLSFKTSIRSDCAPLNGLIADILIHSSGVKWMRDPTRGGIAAVLTELAEEFKLDLLVREKDLPVRENVRAVCELLGFDPMHLANEGKVVAVVESAEAEKVLKTMRAHELGKEAAIIGHVAAIGTELVRVETEVGGVRRLQRPAGELLPRIC